MEIQQSRVPTGEHDEVRSSRQSAESLDDLSLVRRSALALTSAGSTAYIVSHQEQR